VGVKIPRKKLNHTHVPNLGKRGGGHALFAWFLKEERGGWGGPGRGEKILGWGALGTSEVFELFDGLVGGTTTLERGKNPRRRSLWNVGSSGGGVSLLRRIVGGAECYFYVAQKDKKGPGSFSAPGTLRGVGYNW